jgi:branched-chain amino acid transport system permease protein
MTSVSVWRASPVVALLLLVLASPALAQGPVERCRELLPVLVEGPADVRVEIGRGAGEAPPAVRITWRGTAPGDEPQGWLVCWLSEPLPGAWQILAAETSRYGRLSRYDIQQAYKLLRLRGYPLQQFAPGDPRLVRLLYFLQQTLNGLSLGCVYALIAVGYTLVYGITRVINFAWGPLYTLGAFLIVIGVAAGAWRGPETPLVALLLLIIIAMATTAAWGWSMERLVFRPLRHAATSVPLIAAIGLMIALQELIRLAQGPRTRYLLVADTRPWTLVEGEGFDVVLPVGHVLVGAATLLIATGLWWLQTRTDFGRSQRACAQDVRMAALLGVDVDRTVARTFLLGGALAGAAGAFAAIQYGVVTFRMGALVGLKALTASIVGGIGSLPGAILGALIVALTESWTAGYVASEWKEVAVFGLLVGLLWFRPQGLLGTPRTISADERP